MQKTLPTTVTPCPIIEVVSEIIFNRNMTIEPSAVHGKVYDKLKARYSKVENLPIYQLPEVIRLEDENLKNKPWHKFSNSAYSVMIGANVISIVALEPYSCWSEYKKEIAFVLDLLLETDIVASVTRIGLKYVDKFDYPIIGQINLGIKSSLNILESQEMQIRTSLSTKEDMSAIVSIANAVSLVYKDQKQNASILDIDVFHKYENAGEHDIRDVMPFLDKAHDYQKELFFDLIPKKFFTKNNFTLK